MEDVVIV